VPFLFRQIPESLAYVARRRGQWDRSESYFNEAERLDPRDVNLLGQHALSYIFLRRFPEALRKSILAPLHPGHRRKSVNFGELVLIGCSDQLSV